MHWHQRKVYKQTTVGENKHGVPLILNSLYRFKWQTTLAHWYLKEIDGEKAIMRSKHGKEFIGNIHDLVQRGAHNLPNLKK